MTVGATGGLIATGIGGLFSWVVYGTPNPIDHAPAFVLVLALTAIAGLMALRLVSPAENRRKSELSLFRLVLAVLLPAAARLHNGIGDRSDGSPPTHHGQ